MPKDPTDVTGLLGLNFDRDAVLRGGAPDPLEAQREQGRKFGRAGGALLAGAVGGAIQGQRSGAGVGQGILGGLQLAPEVIKQVEDEQIARSMNITPEQLKQRENLQQQLQSYVPTSSDPLEAQIETLNYAFNSAVDPEIKSRIAAQISSLRNQRAELNKLNAETESKQGEEDRAMAGEGTNIVVGADREGNGGKVISATIDPLTGIAYGPDGQPYTDFARHADIKPSDNINTPGGLRKVINDSMTRSEQGKLREAVVMSQAALRSYGSVLADITDSLDADGGVGWLGKPTQATIGFVDTWTRNISNIAQVVGIASPFTEATDPKYQGIAGQARFAKDKIAEAKVPGSQWDGLIAVPPQFQTNAAMISQYKAKIMQLAYMEARATEPSNRGLSDNDIIAALERLQANNPNPQVLLRNFSGKVIEQSRTFEDRLKALPVVRGKTSDDVAFSIMGNSFTDYRNQYDSFKDRFNIAGSDEFGRTIFKPEGVRDVDVQPGEGPEEVAARMAAGEEPVQTEEQAARTKRLNERAAARAAAGQ